MKTKFYLLLFFVLYSVNISNAQTIFQKEIAELNPDEGNSVQLTNDGGYIIACPILVNQFSQLNCFFVAKFNGNGDTLWTRTFHSNPDNYDQAYSVQQTKEGGYIICGSTIEFTSDSDYVYLIKTNDTGDTLWTKAYSNGIGCSGYSIQQTSDSGFIIAGSAQLAGVDSSDVYLIKTDAGGNIQWTKTYGGTGDEEGSCVQQTNDGGYIVVGSTNSFGAGSYDVYLIKTDNSGNLTWSKTYGGSGSDYGNAVQQTNDSEYIIAGSTTSFGVGNDNIYLIKTNSGGDTLWTKTYGGIDVDVARSIQQTNDSGYIICSWSNGLSKNGNDVNLIRINARGDTMWSKGYYGTFGYSAQQAIDGGFIVLGSGIASPFGPIILIKTDGNGYTGCNEESLPVIVRSTTTQITSPATIVSSGGIAMNTATIVGSGSYITTLCSNVGINEISSGGNAISIYPDPAGNELKIKNAGFRIKEIKIYNVIGQKTSPTTDLQERGADVMIDVSKLPAGVYFVRVFDEKESWVVKFVKE